MAILYGDNFNKSIDAFSYGHHSRLDEFQTES